MAISATSQYEVQTGGNDTNGGGFSALTVNTSLDCTSGTTSAPVVTSSTYNFVAGDVGHWLFIKAGTNWIPGWYKIVSVATNAATLDAAIGHVTMYAQGTILNPTTGCATTSTISTHTGQWSIDYTQVSAANTTGSNVSGTGITAIGTATITDVGGTANFQPSLLGNHIYIAGGTGSLTGSWYEVVTVTSTTVIVVDRTVASTVGATMNIGGAMLTILATMDRAWKTAATVKVDTVVWCKSGAYSGATLTTSGYGGPSQYQSRLIGYQTYRGDNPTAQSGNCPSYATTGAASNGWLNTAVGFSIWNFTFDGTGTTGAAVGVTNNGAIESTVNIKVSNYSGGGFNVGPSYFLEAFNNTGVGITGPANHSYSHKNTSHGFAVGNQSGTIFNSIAANNGGSGFSMGYYTAVVNSIAFGNTGSGVICTAALASVAIYNCILAANGAWGINFGGAQTPYNRSMNIDYNAYHNNTSGTVTGGATLGVHDVVISGTASTTPFNQTEANNKAETSPDWTLNNTAGAGALLRATGVPGIQPGILTAASYKDFGPFQHQDSGGGSTSYTGFVMM